MKINSTNVKKLLNTIYELRMVTNIRIMETGNKKPETGKSQNALEVRVAADKIDFAVNGTVVHSMPKAGLKTDGVYGIRVNHLLEVHVEGLAVSK